MTAVIRHHLSPVLALALLATLLAASNASQAAESGYDNVERIDVSSYAAAGIAVSKRVFPDGADAAVLTRDDHFPDALAASALAAKVNGPVLFTATGSLTSSTAAELDRILEAGDTVYITGGDAAVNDNVADQVRARGYEVSRLSGPTRIETAAEIAEVVEAASSGHVLLARARGPAGQDRTTGWVDSVTCGGYANHSQTPILLTKTADLDQATAAALDTLNAKKVTICGGEAAVSGNVAKQLRDAGLTVERVSGATRIETAIDTAKKLFGASSAADQTYVLVTGYGENFGWGLAATPLAGALGAPMLLVGADQPTSCTDTTQRARATLCYLETVGSGSADLIVVGSATQVGDAVRDASAKAAGGNTTPTTTGGDTGGDTSTDGTTTPDPLATPTSVKSSNVSTPSEGRVTVSWAAVSDPDDRLKGYNVYYGESSPDTKAGSSTPTVGADATSFTVGALQLDTTYTFAVTSVTTDGQESTKSAQVSEETTAPTVDLTAPTTAGDPGPTTTEPSATFDVTFTYAASEGATYQVDYLLQGDDTWFSFPETPGTNPGKATATSGEVTRSVTAPSEDGTYDLRVRLFPTGAGTVVTDVESGALTVHTPSSGTVTVTEPTSEQPVLQGGGLDVTFEFSTDQAGTYRLFHRPSGDETWSEFPETSASDPGTFAAGTSPVTTTVTAPETVGKRDLKVELTPEGAEPVQDVVAQAFVVQVPAVTIDEPTTAAPADVAPGQDVTVKFTPNVDGDYTIARRLADQEPEAAWTEFATSDGDGSATAFEQEIVTVTVPEGEPEGGYDLQVTVTRPDSTTVTGTQDAALTVSATQASNDAVEMTAPTNTAPKAVDHDTQSTFDIAFTYSTEEEGRTYELSWSPADQQTWTVFGDADATGTAPVGTDVADSATVTAPGAQSTAKSYDLRVRLLDGSTMTAQSVQAGALTVAASTTPPEPTVDIITPTASEPAEIPSNGQFTFEFSYGAIPSDGAYEVSWRPSAAASGADGPEWQAFDGEGTGSVAGDGNRTLQLGSPPLDGTYDLRVRITSAADSVSISDIEAGALVVGGAGGPELPQDAPAVGGALTGPRCPSGTEWVDYVLSLDNQSGGPLTLRVLFTVAAAADEFQLEYRDGGGTWVPADVDVIQSAPPDPDVTFGFAAYAWEARFPSEHFVLEAATGALPDASYDLRMQFNGGSYEIATTFDSPDGPVISEVPPRSLVSINNDTCDLAPAPV